MAIFIVRLPGMVWSGWIEENATVVEHGSHPIATLDYILSASFQLALFENWESEFLQMAAYVIMTEMLF